MSQWQPQIANIEVIGGIGELRIKQSGLVFALGVIAPSGAIYDITGFDNDGFLQYFGDNISGNVNMAIRAQFDGNHMVRISDTTTDGLYQVKFWYENY